MGARLRSSSHSGRKKRHTAVAEINVTPLVDVMLVLLIVFMVAAPLLTAGVPIDLPQSKAKSLQENDSIPIEISLDRNGKIFIGESEVEEARLIPLLNAMVGNSKDDRRIYLRADKSMEYGRIMRILGAINAGGFQRVALISINDK